MNCSDNVSSDAVLSEKNSSSSRQTGMGYANINQLLPMMKWNDDNLIIILVPDAAFRNANFEGVIISLSCGHDGGQK